MQFKAICELVVDWLTLQKNKQLSNIIVTSIVCFETKILTQTTDT